MMLLNGPEIEDFDFEKAYEHWVNKNQERLVTNLNLFMCNKIQKCAQIILLHSEFYTLRLTYREI